MNAIKLIKNRELWNATIPQNNINIDVLLNIQGVVYDFKRFGDRQEHIRIRNGWRSGSLVYWKTDRFSYRCESIYDFLEVKGV